MPLKTSFFNKLLETNSKTKCHIFIYGLFVVIDPNIFPTASVDENKNLVYFHKREDNLLPILYLF